MLLLEISEEEKKWNKVGPRTPDLVWTGDVEPCVSLKSSHMTRAHRSGILTVMWSTKHSGTREKGCFWYRLVVQS